MDYAKMIDHTLLKPEATSKDIEKLCAEAKLYGFCSVCVNSSNVPFAAHFLSGSGVKVCTVVGFPLGASNTKGKLEEAKEAVHQGANEIDMVQNIGKAKEHDYAYLAKEVSRIKKGLGPKIVLKVILETCLLTDDEIVKSCLAAKKGGADFVKTSTGFSTGGATVEAVRLMRRTVGNKMGVKASGGIHTHAQMVHMIKAGANRIGASAGVKLLTE